MIDLDEILNGIDAVCFDAFGTLVEITGKRRPCLLHPAQQIIGQRLATHAEGPPHHIRFMAQAA